MPYPEDLLEQAAHLANRERRKPRQASLRRAISSAYYALFHLLIEEAARNWKRAEERPKLARMFDHSTMAKACVAKRDQLRAARRTEPDNLLRVAEAFVLMQQHRHMADYDSARRWSRVEARNLVDKAAEAFRLWKAIRHQPEAQDFLVTLPLRDRR